MFNPLTMLYLIVFVMFVTILSVLFDLSGTQILFLLLLSLFIGKS